MAWYMKREKKSNRYARLGQQRRCLRSGAKGPWKYRLAKDVQNKSEADRGRGGVMAFADVAAVGGRSLDFREGSEPSV